ncbi:DUF4184 family protein [Streptomyces sp. NBC_01239]|uniref:DUF4184 family protein n=1 Tax=Streptomyces sp. NBC_01239 TaxID=2903792 RepID=UPI002258445E|nr:DUF4184 family protein [Streptomyces sp. NBC_01239]MCX4810316.1 DUF4184 family protein [Streptomyces sp. NBC_01239]
MPFTLSHAAAVLPAVRGDGRGRGRLVPAVLVAGSFAPDMTYYAASAVPGAMEFGEVTHSFPGVFTVDVAIAWTTVALWLLLREPLVALLPRTRRPRPATLLRCGTPRARATPSLAVRWYVSAVLGALTHVVWDAFTHHDRWGVRLFPTLDRELAGRPLFSLLQYGTSAIGALLITAFMVRALRRVPAAEPVGVPLLSTRDRWAAGIFLTACALAAATERASTWWAYWGSTATPWDLIPTVCFGAGAGLVLGVLLYAVGVRVWRPVGVGAAGGAEEVGAGTGRGRGAR